MRMQGRAAGRLLAYDPKTRATRVLLGGLFFANGVALSGKEDFVAVAETGSWTVRRYWLKGPKVLRCTGQHSH